MRLYLSSACVLVSCLALSASTAHAIDGSNQPPALALAKIRDMVSTVHARRALRQDQTLSRYQIDVVVEDGIAYVHGSVPHSGVGLLAVSKLRDVRGIIDVKLQVSQQAPLQQDLLSDWARPEGSPQRIVVAKPIEKMAEKPAMPMEVRPTVANDGASGAWRPASERVRTREPVVVSKEPEANHPRTLADRIKPIQPVARKPEARAVIGIAPLTLAERVAAVRNSRVDFRAIPVRLDGGTITVVRNEDTKPEAEALADALRTLPGARLILVVDE